MSADDVGLSVVQGRNLREPVLAIGDRCEELEELQLMLGQGPGMDAAATDRPVLVPDLSVSAAADRWPVFAPAAVAHGAYGMFAFPVAIGAARIGVLDVYRRRPGSLSAAELADGLAFADAVLLLALDERGGLTFGAGRLIDGELPERRADVHQAAGMVSVQLGVGVDEALARLRAYAYVNGQRLVDVAAAVLARHLRLDSHDDNDVTAGIGITDIMDAPPSVGYEETEGEK
ncbi:ANTAR domain-containing protein [Jiangella asiatica]|uniref:ANTAR domain-containing protein n=1 Tax=Jiangella asiatica TaxID=2530372 RepID=A0A4R5CVT1_9ACTN|nr:ANTAR domain-containing protein [Jiangella asiatica]TDE03131.1 ANTAR domain-containing protein [Jiangella asiatica]